jgi:CoA-transferase family III
MALVWRRTLSALAGSLRDPLSGSTVLDLTRVVAGPYCTQLLGDLGAKVFKVERPVGGDETRRWGPPYIGDSDLTCYFVCVNRNKLSVCIDLKSPRGIVSLLYVFCMFFVVYWLEIAGAELRTAFLQCG